MRSTLTSTTLRGTWGTLLLAIRDDDTIDWSRTADALDTLVAAGPDGVYVHGTAGEFHTLGEDEYDRVNALVTGRCAAAGIPVQIGASHMSAQTALRRVARARALEPAAIQVTLPDWLPLAPDEVVRFLTRVAAEADPVPLVLYNPPHAKTRVEPGRYAAIRREVPSLIGVKVAEYDAAMPGDLAVFVAGHRLASARRQGAAGSYSNVACLRPAGAMAWQSTMDTDPDAALDVERRINAFLAAHVTPLALSNPALDKFLAHVGGWAGVGTRIRWPYTAADPGLAEALRPRARELLPELF